MLFYLNNMVTSHVIYRQPSCIFSELATLQVVLVVSELSEGGYKGLFCFEK